MIKNLPKTSVCSRLTYLQYLKLFILVFVQFLFVSSYAQVNSYTLTSTIYTGAAVGPVPAGFTPLTASAPEPVTQLYAAGSNFDSGVNSITLPYNLRVSF